MITYSNETRFDSSVPSPRHHIGCTHVIGAPLRPGCVIQVCTTCYMLSLDDTQGYGTYHKKVRDFRVQITGSDAPRAPKAAKRLGIAMRHRLSHHDVIHVTG